MRTRTQGGFTLVEITLVLAISGLLILLLLHQHTAILTQQFTGGVEKVRNELVNARNQAISGRNDEGSGNTTMGASGQSAIFWGKLVWIKAGQLKVYTMHVNTDGLTAQNPVKSDLDNTLTIPWGVQGSPAGTTYCVAFLRDPYSAALSVYYPSCTGANPPTTVSSYAPASTVLTVPLTDGSGRTARIIVNGSSQAVTEKIP